MVKCFDISRRDERLARADYIKRVKRASERYIDIALSDKDGDVDDITILSICTENNVEPLDLFECVSAKLTEKLEEQ